MPFSCTCRQISGLNNARSNLLYMVELRNDKRPHSFDASAGVSLSWARWCSICADHSSALSGLRVQEEGFRLCHLNLEAQQHDLTVNA